MNNLDMNIFFIVTAIILLVCYYNENKVLNILHLWLQEDNIKDNDSKQCQNRCENKRYEKMEVVEQHGHVNMLMTKDS